MCPPAEIPYLSDLDVVMYACVSSESRHGGTSDALFRPALPGGGPRCYCVVLRPACGWGTALLWDPCLQDGVPCLSHNLSAGGLLA